VETDWTLYLTGHGALHSDEPKVDPDYLWTCECGAKGEDIETRDAHVLSALCQDDEAAIRQAVA